MPRSANLFEGALASGSICRAESCLRWSRNRAVARLLWVLVLLPTVGCKKGHLLPVDTSSLSQAGMSSDSINTLQALEIRKIEVVEMAKAKQGGLSDEACIELIRVARSQNQSFDHADVAAGLFQAGMAGSTIVELARLRQLGFGAGELQALRLSGLPDSMIIEVAQKRSEGKPVLSGPSITQLMNTSMSRETLSELIQRDVADGEVAAILDAKRRHFSDSDILRALPCSSDAGPCLKK